MQEAVDTVVIALTESMQVDSDKTQTFSFVLITSKGDVHLAASSAAGSFRSASHATLHLSPCTHHLE